MHFSENTAECLAVNYLTRKNLFIREQKTFVMFSEYCDRSTFNYSVGGLVQSILLATSAIAMING